MAFANQSNLPVLDSSSAPPNLFDGTARLYISFISPFAQRAWSARNFKCPDKIEVIAISLADKPSWYAEKVYPAGKVPSLEHNGKVIGESLDILEYIDQNFEGPALYPQDSVKKDAVKELLMFTDKFMMEVFTLGRNKEATKSEMEQNLRPHFDKLEAALGKFEEEGPYFTGQFGAVDLVYAPLIERIELLLPEIVNYDIYTGRPRLLKWFQAMNTMDAYTSTKCDPQVLLKYLCEYDQKVKGQMNST